MEHITAPLETPEQGKDHLDGDGYLSATVAIDLSDAIDGDLETWLDRLSLLLVGNELLMDVNYELVGVLSPLTMLVKVTGDPSMAWGLDDGDGE